MSWEKMFLGLKQKLFQRGTGWEQWEQALWEGTGPPEHTFSGDRMPAQPTVPFVSQSSGPALCVKRCGLEGGGRRNNCGSYKKALQKMQWGEVGGGTDEV